MAQEVEALTISCGSWSWGINKDNVSESVVRLVSLPSLLLIFISGKRSVIVNTLCNPRITSSASAFHLSFNIQFIYVPTEIAELLGFCELKKGGKQEKYFHASLKKSNLKKYRRERLMYCDSKMITFENE